MKVWLYGALAGVLCWGGWNAAAAESGVVREWRPGTDTPPAKVAWTPSGGALLKVKEPAAAAEGIGRVWRFDSKETDKALACSVKLAETGLKLENGWFEFTYWLPEDSKVVKLRPGVRVREGERKGKLIAADVTPVKGMWTTVRWPLDGAYSAAARRAGGEHADSLELGVLASGGPIVLEIGRLAAGVSAPPASGGAAAADADNIYSAALAPEVLGVWNAGEELPAFAGVWAPGRVTRERTKPAASSPPMGNPEQVFRFETEANALALTFRVEAPLADTWLEFAYFLPGGSSVRSVNPGMTVREWDGRRRTLRLPPVTGRWQREKISLAELMGGDTWRGGAAATASSFEIGFLGDKGSPLAVEIAEVRLTREATPFTPLVRPQWLVEPGSYRRTFTVNGTPEKAWIMALAEPAFTLRVNGREIGRGVLGNHNGWAMNPRWPVAAEWPLDGVLREGENRIEFEIAPGTARGMVALGWEEQDLRRVIVSDAAWSGASGKAAVRPIGEQLRLRGLDIYPVRMPGAWRPPAERPDYAGGPAFRPAAARLQVAPEAGRWSTVEVNGRWYLRSPSGKPFFFNGTQVIGRIYENYGYSDWARRAYSSEKEWADEASGFVQRLGFNGLAVSATSDTAFAAGARRGMVYFTYLGCHDGGPGLMNRNGEKLPGVPDPFSEEWRRKLRRRAAEAGKRWNGDPACVGFFVNNEAHLEGNLAGRSSSGFVYSEACGWEFVRWLRERYRDDLRMLNLAWFGKAEKEYLDSFEDVLVKKPDPLGKVPFMADPTAAAAMAQIGRRLGGDERDEKKGRMRRDFDDFAVYTVGVYADYVLRTMREFMPDKIIGSNRFMGASTEEMLAVWKDYDVIAWNSYPMWVWKDAKYVDRQIAEIEKAHRVTGKPVLLTEWGVQALDVRMASPSAQLTTQRERGIGHGKVVKQVVERFPFVAGMVHFAYQNLADSEGQGWGLVDNEGRPYRDFVSGVVAANRWLDGYFSDK